MDDEEALEIADARFDMLPERKLLIGLIPFAGSAISTYLQGRRDRTARRAAEFQVAMLEEARMSPEEILEKVSGDERLEELFWFAMDAATRTSLEAKRRTLGRIFAQGIIDDADVDETEVLLRTLEGLEGPHIRVLQVFVSGQNIKELSLYTDSGDKPFGRVVYTRDEVEALARLPKSIGGPVLQTLLNASLIDARPPRELLITAFGETLVQWVKKSEVRGELRGPEISGELPSPDP